MVKQGNRKQEYLIENEPCKSGSLRRIFYLAYIDWYCSFDKRNTNASH